MYGGREYVKACPKIYNLICLKKLRKDADGLGTYFLVVVLVYLSKYFENIY